MSLSINSRIKNTKASFYEGARPTTATREFSMAGSTPFEQLVKTERVQLRARGRWLKANNPLMFNIDETLVNNAFRGIYIKFSDDNYQKLFDKWATAKNCDSSGKNSFYGIINLADTQRYPDGEVFIYKSFGKQGLKLRIFEADHIDESKGVNGLEINGNGAVTGYWVFENNPKDTFDGFTSYRSRKIPARHIIHYYRQTSTSQYRGVSEYARVIFELKNLMAFQTNSMEAMIAKAAQAYSVTTSGDHSNFGASEEDKLQTINGAIVNYLRTGESIEMHDSSTTPINYREFITSAIRICCVGREVSYELGSRDYSNVNFTSSRAGKIEDNKTLDGIQLLGLDKLIRPILEAWAEVEYLKGNLPTPEVPDFHPVFPIREWVRPKEDLDYHLTAIENNVGTRDELCRKMHGRSYKETLEQIAREKELTKDILGEDEVIKENEPKDRAMAILTQKIQDLEEQISEKN